MGGRPVALEFGRTFQFGAEQAVYVRGNWDDAIYYVPKASLTSVQADLASVAVPKKQASPPVGNVDMSSLKHLPPEVREQLMRQIQEEKQKKDMLRAFQEQKSVRETK